MPPRGDADGSDDLLAPVLSRVLNSLPRRDHAAELPGPHDDAVVIYGLEPERLRLIVGVGGGVTL